MSNQHFRFKFRRPFANMTGKNGQIADAWVAYANQPYEVYTHVAPDNSSAEEIISRYQHALVLDLYFVMLRFNWKGPENAKVKKLRARQANQHLDARAPLSNSESDRK